MSLTKINEKYLALSKNCSTFANRINKMDKMARSEQYLNDNGEYDLCNLDTDTAKSVMKEVTKNSEFGEVNTFISKKPLF